MIDYFDNKILEEDLSKDDYLIILGDVGFDYNDSLIRILQNLPVTVLFIDGNHDNMDLLNEYEEELWRGGKVHIIEEDIIHLMRGQVFNIDNKTFFTFGGGYSIDKHYRQEGLNWRKDEMPNSEEYYEGNNNLESVNYKVDYVLTHSAPYEIVCDIVSEYFYGEEELQYYLQDVYESLDFKQWYFGHFHQDYENGQFKCLYQEIVELYD